MTATTSTTSVLPFDPRMTLSLCSLWRHHIHALPNEIVRRILTYLDPRQLRRAAQVCIRWHILASALIAVLQKESYASFLPWNVMKQVFALLDLGDLRNAAWTCARWRFIAYGFFSLRLGRTHIHDQPAELIDYLFSFLDFESLRIAAQVCVRWRDQGIDHPTFWQNIEAKSATFGSLELLAARLGQSMGRPFALTIDIEGLHRLIETKLMALLTAIMPTVQKLHIRLNSFYVFSLWPVLNHHAPQLTSFHLKLYCPDRIMARVPLNRWIFDNLPGKLEEVSIEDVMTSHETPGFPAFANLRHLQLRYAGGTTSPSPAYLFENCPNLRSFFICCGRFKLGDSEAWSKAALDGLGRLESLQVQIDPDARDEFVNRMPLRDDIPIIAMPTPPSDNAAYDFLAGLRHPFIFALLGVDDTLNVIVQDIRSGYTRKFMELKRAYACEPSSNYAVNVLFENEEFPAQVEFMKISLSLWDLLVPYLSHYTSLAKLVIDIELVSTNAYRIQRLRGRPLEFPALETLVLETSEVYIYVLIDDVMNFVDNVLRARQCRKLELRRVHLRGYDVAPIDERFDQILYSNEVHSGSPIVRKSRL